MIHTRTSTNNNHTDQVLTDIQRRELLIKELEIQSLSKTILAPTDDTEVKLQLRSLGEPICYFGEGPGDRRDRLRLLLARIHVESRDKQGEGALKAEEEEEGGAMEDESMTQELTFTEGPDRLPFVRMDIAQFSLRRAQVRTKRQQVMYEQICNQAKKMPNQSLDTKVVEYKRLMSELSEFDCLSSQIGDHRPLSSVSVVPREAFNGTQLILSSSWSGHVKLWNMNVQECTCVQSYKAHNERIVHVVSNPVAKNQDTLSFATASADKTIKIWQIKVTGKIEEDAARSMKQIEAERKRLSEQVSKSEDQNAMEDDENGGQVGHHYTEDTATSDLDNASTTVVKCVTLKGHTNRLSRLCYHQSGSYLFSTSFDKTWRFWDLETETCLYEQDGHKYPVYGIAMHPDGSLCGTSDLGGIVRVWDLRIGRTIMPWRAHVQQCLSLDFSPNGYHIATSGDDNTVKVWDLRKFANMEQVSKSMFVIPAHSKLISRVQYEPVHGRFLSSAGYDGMIKVWNSLDYKMITTCKGHDGKVMYTDMIPSTAYSVAQIVSCGYDRTIKQWWKSDHALQMLKNL